MFESEGREGSKIARYLCLLSNGVQVPFFLFFVCRVDRTDGQTDSQTNGQTSSRRALVPLVPNGHLASLEESRKFPREKENMERHPDFAQSARHFAVLALCALRSGREEADSDQEAHSIYQDAPNRRHLSTDRTIFPMVALRILCGCRYRRTSSSEKRLLLPNGFAFLLSLIGVASRCNRSLSRIDQTQRQTVPHRSFGWSSTVARGYLSKAAKMPKLAPLGKCPDFGVSACKGIDPVCWRSFLLHVCFSQTNGSESKSSC